MCAHAPHTAIASGQDMLLKNTLPTSTMNKSVTTLRLCVTTEPRVYQTSLKTRARQQKKNEQFQAMWPQPVTASRGIPIPLPASTCTLFNTLQHFETAALVVVLDLLEGCLTHMQICVLLAALPRAASDVPDKFQNFERANISPRSLYWTASKAM